MCSLAAHNTGHTPDRVYTKLPEREGHTYEAPCIGTCSGRNVEVPQPADEAERKQVCTTSSSMLRIFGLH